MYLIAVGTLPLGIALALLAQQQRSSASPAGPRAALEEVSASSRDLLAAADSNEIPPALREALDRHVEVVVRGTRLARQADTLTRTAAAALTIAILAIGILILTTSVFLARRWSASITAPIEELIDWVERIDRQDPIPETARTESSDYDELRRALRAMAENLDAARAQTIEQERLQAFRETARRVAHEVRGPLTSIRLALNQMPPEPSEPLAVLNDEAARLDRLASEFADFGRMAAGPLAEINLEEMLNEIVSSTLGSTVVEWDVEGDSTVSGRFDSLRRALQNILTNAGRITDERGIRLKIRSDLRHASIRIADHGPGIPPDRRESIFDPYVTGHQGGTGLGLAIARQAVEEHGGNIEVQDNDPGAVFLITLPRTR